MTATKRNDHRSVKEFSEAIIAKALDGGRFCGLFASTEASGIRLDAVFADDPQLFVSSILISESTGSFPSLSPHIPSASWYEREIYDLFGLLAIGPSGPYPLVLPLSDGHVRPRPGSGSGKSHEPFEIDLSPLVSHLKGEGVFTIPYGPVRSGVF